MRLIGSNGTILDDRVITLAELDEHGDEDANHIDSFALTLPAPSQPVARLELLHNTTVLATLAPGLAQPSVRITAPTSGTIIGDQLVIRWEASDPDPTDQLRAMVQYSADAGQSWQALAMNLPSDPSSISQELVLNDLGWLASSPAARLRVMVSDGYNTILASAGPFVVNARPPQAMISAPFDGEHFPAGGSILISGTGHDNEDGQLASDALTWSLDGVVVGNGAERSLDGLAPGRYQLALRVRDSAGTEGRAEVGFVVEPLQIPVGLPPGGDLFCDDPAYASATPLRLTPYANGNQAQVRLIRTATTFWVCFTNLAPTPEAGSDRIGVWIDLGHRRNSLAQPEDYGLLIGSDGLSYLLKGDGQGGFNEEVTDIFQARLFQDVRGRTAEFQIPLANLSNVGGLIGLNISHQFDGPTPTIYAWPHRASFNQPRSWATSALAALPNITGLDPSARSVGSPGFTLTISGTNFVTDSVVAWEGSPRPTSYVSPNLLRATISAADLVSARQARVTVINPVTADSPATATLFAIENPLPVITRARLEAAGSRPGARTLVVEGSGFADGATLQWAGDAQPTLRVDANRIEASVDFQGLSSGMEVPITVYNPGPGGGLSNSYPVTINDSGNSTLFLPLIAR